jgi:hypothetical protein
MAYPKVAPDVAMYWPSVRIIPLEPGPNLIMFVAPKQRSENAMSCQSFNCHTKYKSDDQADSFGNVSQRA